MGRIYFRLTSKSDFQIPISPDAVLCKLSCSHAFLQWDPIYCDMLFNAKVN